MRAPWVISQLRENQVIEYRGKKRNLKDYFNTINKGVDVILRVRDGEDINASNIKQQYLRHIAINRLVLRFA